MEEEQSFFHAISTIRSAWCRNRWSPRADEVLGLRPWHVPLKQ